MDYILGCQHRHRHWGAADGAVVADDDIHHDRHRHDVPQRHSGDVDGDTVR